MRWLSLSCLVATLTLAGTALANVDYYRIYPTNFEVQAETIWHNFFHVVNGDNQSVRLKLVPEQFDVGHRGPYADDRSLIPQKDRHFDLVPYMHFSPKYMALAPFAHKKVSIRVILPKDLKPGTYWGRIKFMMQKPPKNPLQIHRPSKIGLGTEIFPLIDESVPVYIDVKAQHRNLKSIKVTCQKMAANKLEITIVNPTDWAFEPVYHIKVAHENRDEFHQRSYPVMPQSQGTRYLSTFNHTILSNTITYTLPHSDKVYTLVCKPS